MRVPVPTGSLVDLAAVLARPVTANDVNGAVTIYATSAAATSNGSAGKAGTLYRISDVSGVNGTLSGIPVEIATAPVTAAYPA